MTPFCFEHVFAAPSPAAVFAAYFDKDQQAEQDRAIDIAEREVLELTDRGDELYRVTRIVPRRQLPGFLRPFVSGPLHYLETQRWRRSEDRIDIEIRPSLTSGRTRIEASYELKQVRPGSVLRRYAGTVSVNISLVSARVERGIVGEFERSMPVAAACTQAWLDRRVSPGRT